MKFTALETGNFKIDAGPMFGVIPKSMWSKVYESDENNMCIMANRCLLVETDNKLILVDAGIGNKVNDKLVKHFCLKKEENIVAAIYKAGYKPEDITDVIFTHLHWDHCGGAIDYTDETCTETSLVFPQAVHHIGSKQYDWALNPNKREAAAYPPNYIASFKNAKLNLIENNCKLIPNVEVFLSDGHTPGQLIPVFKSNNYNLAFMGDLVPTSAHVPLLWVSAYDVYPLSTINEKERFLEIAYQNNYILMFEHDPVVECAKIEQGIKGYEIVETFELSSL